VALLGIALGAMILGCLLLLLILNRYEFKTKVSAMTTPVATAQAALASLQISENLVGVRL